MALRNLGFTNICNVHSPQKILDVLRKEQEKEEIGSDTMADTLKILTHEQSTLSLKQTRAELPKGNTQEAIWSPPDVLEDYVSTIATQEDILIFLQDGDVTYVDVREPTEFAQKTRVAGSICISCTVTNWEKLETAVFEGRFPEKTEKIAVYCNHGIRSSYAERALRSWGYGNVLNCHNPETILRCLETIKQEEKTRPGAGVVRERKSSAPGTRWVARGVLQKERSRRESIGKDEVWNDSHFVALEWKVRKRGRERDVWGGGGGLRLRLLIPPFLLPNQAPPRLWMYDSKRQGHTKILRARRYCVARCADNDGD